MTAGFPRNGKSFRDFSTQWKKCFHTVENYCRVAAPAYSSVVPVARSAEPGAVPIFLSPTVNR
jgi:hypothetical protein